MLLQFHENSAQVVPCEQGIPWLRFVITPQRLQLKSRNSRHATHRLAACYRAWQRGKISFGELDASVQGWITHAGFADSWALRRRVL